MAQGWRCRSRLWLWLRSSGLWRWGWLTGRSWGWLTGGWLTGGWPTGRGGRTGRGGARSLGCGGRPRWGSGATRRPNYRRWRRRTGQRILLNHRVLLPLY
ncbi:MAG: hypothetical protein EA368_15965 [Leptolyngbya sp. DLM2.Bin27]|nr:MAG: hypothetical protein EA368_15965 [Leptolyngbya sp. DLM2.Bin27]